MEVDREAWLAERRTGIGASDAPAACGLSPWSSPLGIYLDKTGQLPDAPMSPEMRWGLRLEPAIAQAYTEETGFELRKPAEPVCRHPTITWMICTPDRLADGHLVELKTARKADGWGDPGTDQVPEMYLIQATHQMHVTGTDRCDIAVLIGGSDFRIYTVPYHRQLAEWIVGIEAELWDRIQRRDPPDPDWQHPGTAALVGRMFGLQEESVTVLGDEALEWVKELEAARARTQTAKHEADMWKSRILYHMGDAAVGLLPDGSKAERKFVVRKPYEVEGCEYIDFRIKRPPQPEKKRRHKKV